MCTWNTMQWNPCFTFWKHWLIWFYPTLWRFTQFCQVLQRKYLVNSSREPCCQAAYSWWRHQMETFLRYWPFVRGIHMSPVNFPHKGQCRGTLMFSLICVRTNSGANSRDTGDSKRHRAHYDVTTIFKSMQVIWKCFYRHSLSKFLTVSWRAW